MNSSLRRIGLPAAVVLLGLLALGAFFWLGPNKLRKLEAFPAATYLESPANLHGNRYLLDAWIESQLIWREGVGRILEVRPAQGGGKIAVFVPDSIQRNLHAGQRYRMEVRVQTGGIIHVQDLEKY